MDGHHCYAMTGRSAEMTERIYAWSPITSREVLEWPNCDLMRLVLLDRTLHYVQCNTLGYTTSASTDRTHPPERSVTARAMFGH